MSGPAQQVASFSNFDHKTPEMESRDFRDPYTRTQLLLFTFIIYFVIYLWHRQAAKLSRIAPVRPESIAVPDSTS